MDRHFFEDGEGGWLPRREAVYELVRIPIIDQLIGDEDDLPPILLPPEGVEERAIKEIDFPSRKMKAEGMSARTNETGSCHGLQSIGVRPALQIGVQCEVNIDGGPDAADRCDDIAPSFANLSDSPLNTLRVVGSIRVGISGAAMTKYLPEGRRVFLASERRSLPTGPCLYL